MSAINKGCCTKLVRMLAIEGQLERASSPLRVRGEMA